MAHDAHIRAKAIELRTQRSMTIDEIAERLAVSRTTVYAWVRDLPIARRPSDAARRAGEVTRLKHLALRAAAYRQGAEEFGTLAADPGFRDFVCMYIGEGFKRNRNRVSIGNSDPAVVALSVAWLRRLSRKAPWAALQYHADQDPEELRAYWADRIGLDDPAAIRLQRKSNSNGLTGRTWRSRHGVLTVGVDDTYLRARLQAWMDLIRQGWL